jgi:hypothetical protein
MTDLPQLQAVVPAIVPPDRESAGINPATCDHRWAYNPFGGYDYWCQTCLIPGKVPNQMTTVEAITRALLGETVVTNDRVLNHALQQAGDIISRRDISPLDKFEMLAAYVLKARREVLGRPED